MRNIKIFIYKITALSNGQPSNKAVTHFGREDHGSN